MGNSAFMHRFDALGGLELLVADFSDHRFDVHWHDTWSIGVVLRGANNNSAKGDADGIVSRGQVSLIAPGQMHAGTVLGEEGCHYFMFYPSHEMLLDAAENMEMPLPPAVKGKHIDHAPFANRLCEAATVLTAAQSSRFDREVAWSHCVADLLAVCSPRRAPLADAGIAPGLRRAKEYLHDNPARKVRLERLAQAAGLSRFHLCRQFSATFGLSPSRYQRQLRLQQAKALLSRGGDIAEIAVVCGFADQSHLGRAFKSSYGVTPRGYRDRCL
ncbi:MULTISPECIES: AraC family transcriptional regulator [Serratia]|nr:AraC family transcriptional regulator [Serratia marcescens]CAI1818004.1 L-rhamnose operon regulatory protein rhaS [Serratia marcescens]